jgi:hypothetical protein
LQSCSKISASETSKSKFVIIKREGGRKGVEGFLRIEDGRKLERKGLM